MSQRRHTHAIWHGFVILGSACHFVAVSMQVGSSVAWGRAVASAGDVLLQLGDLVFAGPR